jgi:hypothetical protein
MTQTYLITFKGKEVEKLGDMAKDILDELTLESCLLPKNTIINIQRVKMKDEH